MINLAGRADCDPIIEQELFVAGIEPVHSDEPHPRNEVPARVTGRLGPVTFERAWYYWIARGEVPLAIAEQLYEQQPYGRRDVRVGGHCGCPHPREYGTTWVGEDGRPIYVLHDADRKSFEQLGELSDAWAAIVRQTREEVAFVETQAERERLAVRAYVDTYHIDTAAGLKVFVEAIRTLSEPPTLELEHDPERGDDCTTCPLHWYNDDGFRCAAAPGRGAYHENDVTPDWCPLRNGGRVVVKGAGS